MFLFFSSVLKVGLDDSYRKCFIATNSTAKLWRGVRRYQSLSVIPNCQSVLFVPGWPSTVTSTRVIHEAIFGYFITCKLFLLKNLNINFIKNMFMNMSTKAEIYSPSCQPTESSFVHVDILNEVGKEQDCASMEELKLQSIQLLDEKDGQNFYAPEEKALIRKEEIGTDHGKLHVTLHGTEGKPAIITFHDIGQNHVSAFQSFLNCTEMAPILQYFTIYHIDAPGQQEGAVQLPETFLYPSIDDLAEMVSDVVTHFKLRSFVGLGIGAGASILCRYGLKYPKLVDGLLLVNCFSGKSGWVEWGYEKVRFLDAFKLNIATISSSSKLLEISCTVTCLDT